MDDIVSDLPLGLQALVDQNLIGSVTLEVVRNLNNLSVVGPDGQIHYCVPDEEPRVEQTSSFIHAWNLFDIIPPSVEGEPPLEELLPAALMIYTARGLGPMGLANSVSRAGRAHLSIRLPMCLAQRSEEEEHALFWCWMVTVETWKYVVNDLHQEGVKLRDSMLHRFPWCASATVATGVLGNFHHDTRLLANYGRFVGQRSTLKLVQEAADADIRYYSKGI